ncbi:hypothetical protein BGZ72_010427 [Mortierella alpina]|nr:hypothetical protein BGZ72_010427 [Mortierella alpina]
MSHLTEAAVPSAAKPAVDTPMTINATPLIRTDFAKRARATRRTEASDLALELEETVNWEEAIAVAEEADELEEVFRLIEEQALMGPEADSQAESSTSRKRPALATSIADKDAAMLDELWDIINLLRTTTTRTEGSCDLDAGNKCVSVSILRNRLKEAYGNEFKIPSNESIRAALKKLGCSDYHENMNSSIFEKYLDDLCRHCKDELGFPSVVFVMGNAKYHRREYRGDRDSIHQLSGTDFEMDVEVDEPKHKTLCQLSKPELYDRLCRVGAERETIDRLSKAALYEMAKKPEYKVPLATEVLVERFTGDPSWISDLNASAIYPIDNELERRAEEAFLARPLDSENSHLALKTLASFGLVAHMSSIASPMPIAQCIQSVLARKSHNMAFIISSTIKDSNLIQPSPLLLLRELARQLHINIYVFGSRGKPKRFLGGQAPKKKRAFTSLEPEDCERILKKVCYDHLVLEAKKEAKKLQSSSQTPEEALEKLRARLHSQKRLPQGIFLNTVKLANEAAGSTEVTDNNVRSRLDSTGGALHHWKEVINDLDKIWNTAIENVGKDGDDQLKSDQKEASQDVLRTCTTSLDKVLRPELHDEYDLVLKTLETTQNSVSTTMEELSVLALKTVHVIASGQLYGPEVGGPVATGFDLTSILPFGFVPRDRTHPTRISVAPIPRLLETYIDLKPKSDLATLLSQEHLQFIYARCLRDSSSRTSKGDEEHPVWRRAVDLIPHQNLPVAPDGLKTTFLGHIKQYSVAIENLWSGPTHRKLLDFVAAAVSKKREEAALRGPKPRSKTNIKWRTSALSDELAEALNAERPIRVQAILHQLYKLHISDSELTPSTMDISQEEQEGHMAQEELEELDTAVTEEVRAEISENPFQDVLESLLLDDEIDMDELEEAFEEVKGETSGQKEPSRRHLQALGAVLRMLLESPAINFTITANYVSQQAHKGKTFTAQECLVVASLANTLRPYVPKRRPSDNGGFKGPLEHVAARAAFAVLTCSILRCTGYHQFTRSFSPEISPSSTQALLLSAPAIWETFCSLANGVYDIQDAAGKPLTRMANVTNPPENKVAVFSAFLGMKEINEICAQHGLSFANRYTVHITGTVVPHGENRKGYPQTSIYEERKKAKIRASLGNSWREEYERSGMSTEEITARRDELAEEVQSQENALKELRKVVADKESLQSEESRALSEMKHMRGTAEEHGQYSKLRDARLVTRESRTILLPKEAELRSLRQELYFLNKLSDAAKSAGKRRTKKSDPPPLTQPQWDMFTTEDATEYLDISQLMSTSGHERQIVFSGTDYGLCTMSETVPQTLEEIQVHINRYNLLKGKLPGGDQTPATSKGREPSPSKGPEPPPSKDPDQPPIADAEAVPAVTRSQERRRMLQALKLPRAHRTTAKQINDVSHSMQTGRRRERRLKKNTRAKAAQGELAKLENVLLRATTMEDIDRAQANRRQAGPHMKSSNDLRLGFGIYAISA